MNLSHDTGHGLGLFRASAYAYFKSQTERTHLFTPVRAGKLNHETAFVLERFGVPVPAGSDRW